MFGFTGTECKIEGCNNPVWPSKTKGLCNLHYQREKRGRMNPDGTLISLSLRQGKCETCGNIFDLKLMANNVRWCPTCRTDEYRKIQNENNHGIYRREKTSRMKMRKLREKYFMAVAFWFDKKAKKIVKYRVLLEMRKQGESLRKIGEKHGMSGQRVAQIINEISH